MFKSFAISCLCVFSSGCASAVPVNGPDGTQGWFAIECSRSQAVCYQKAGEICPGGYNTVESHGNTGMVMSVNNYGGYAVTTYRGEMLIKCINP